MKPGYKQTEVGAIPEEWEVCPVRQKGEVLTGKALAANAPGQQRPYLRTKNVFDGRIDIDDVLTMPMTDEQFVQFQIRNGDVLLNEGQSLDLVGRCSIYQDEYHEPCAIQNALLRFRARVGVSGKFASYLFRHCQQTGVFAQIALQTTSIAHLGGSRFERLCLAWPTEDEQRAIAAALSEVDALLAALDRLIAKKRDLKQAAMQQLLTGQTRLPGFEGEWVVKRLGECLLLRPDYGINAAAVPFSDKLPSYLRITDISEYGRYCPDPRVSVKAANADQYYLHEGDVVFARTGASVGKSYLYESRDGELVFAGFLIRVRPNPEILVSAFLAAFTSTEPYWNWVRLMSMRSGQPGINGNEFAQLPLSLPPLPEQTAIAAVLSDMDAELAALEQRREKTRALKQGMMQELLTGRTRLVTPASLVTPATNVVPVDFTQEDTVKPAASGKSHNWAINEAVVVAVLAKNFGSEKFPLGRKRCTKLSYLLHRHVESVAQGYLKKAAGPYNPSVKYRGPEGIAQKNGYIRPHKNGTFSGFVAADKVAQAEDYFEKWYGADALAWLEQFRFRTNDDLEVLATVDMAREDLRRAGKAATVESVKELIRAHPEWKAKLDRPVFADPKIQAALTSCAGLFG